MLLIGAGLRFGENLAYYIAATFAITYFAEIRGGDRAIILNAVLVGAALECLPFFALASDRWGRLSRGRARHGRLLFRLFWLARHA